MKFDISTNNPKAGKAADVTIELPATVAEMVKAWGEEATYGLAKKAAAIEAQAVVRGQLGRGEKAADIVAAMKTWRPRSRAAPAAKSTSRPTLTKAAKKSAKKTAAKDGAKVSRPKPTLVKTRKPAAEAAEA